MINSVTLLGSSSGRNAGDAALIAGIIAAVDEASGRNLRWEVPTICPSYIRKNYRGDVHPVSMLPWSLSVKMLGLPTYQSIMRTDLSLIFDAILFDRSLYNPLFNYLSTVSYLLPKAKRRGKILGCYDVGVGPVTTPAGRSMLARLMEIMDFITVRDDDSKKLLQDIGVDVSRVLVTADAALNMPACSEDRTTEILNSVGFSPGEEVLGINLSKYIDTWAGAGTEPMGNERFIKTYADALNQVLEKIKVPVLFVCTQHHDVALTKALMDSTTKAPKKAIITNVNYNHYEIKGVLSRLSMLCGMRLHATILASSSLVPTLGLPHQPKVTHYFRTLGLEDRIITFKDYSVNSFRDFLLKGWSERATIRQRLEQAIPISKGRALKAAELIAALDKGESVGSGLERLRAA